MSPAKIALALGAVFAAAIMLSFVHPWGNPRAGGKPDTPLLVGSELPHEVGQVMAAKCGDCHSANTRLPVYSRLAPVSWLLEYDIHEGRSHFDMSEWQRYSRESQVDLLTRVAAEVRSGEMPIKRYLIVHPQARLSSDEQQLIYDWAKSERRRIKKQAEKPAENQRRESDTSDR